jgi:hypothetical protein
MMGRADWLNDSSCQETNYQEIPPVRKNPACCQTSGEFWPLRDWMNAAASGTRLNLAFSWRHEQSGESRSGMPQHFGFRERLGMRDYGYCGLYGVRAQTKPRRPSRCDRRRGERLSGGYSFRERLGMCDDGFCQLQGMRARTQPRLNMGGNTCGPSSPISD